MGEMMRNEIWQLLDSRGLGGIETHVAILCSELRARGFLSRVVFLEDHGPHPLGLRLARHGIPTDTLVKPKEIAARLKRDRPMLLHTHGLQIRDHWATICPNRLHTRGVYVS